jgi:hypothetical protein
VPGAGFHSPTLPPHIVFEVGSIAMPILHKLRLSRRLNTNENMSWLSYILATIPIVTIGGMSNLLRRIFFSLTPHSKISLFIVIPKGKY